LRDVDVESAAMMPENKAQDSNSKGMFQYNNDGRNGRLAANISIHILPHGPQISTMLRAHKQRS
jgi:hypothetical protein